MANLPFIGRLLYMHQQTNPEDWGRTRARSGVHKTDARGSYAVEWPKLNLKMQGGVPARLGVYGSQSRGPCTGPVANSYQIEGHSLINVKPSTDLKRKIHRSVHTQE